MRDEFFENLDAEIAAQTPRVNPEADPEEIISKPMIAVAGWAPERQCWAYSPTKTRCTRPAGHDDLHAVETVWDDAECWNPSTPTKVEIAEYGTAAMQVYQGGGVSSSVVAAEPCVACEHNHRGGVCKCGCYEHIA